MCSMPRILIVILYKRTHIFSECCNINCSISVLKLTFLTFVVDNYCTARAIRLNCISLAIVRIDVKLYVGLNCLVMTLMSSTNHMYHFAATRFVYK